MTSNIHVPIGKVRFESEQILSNFASVMEAVMAARPAAVKGIYLKRVTMTSTMGPGVRVDLNAASALTAA